MNDAENLAVARNLRTSLVPGGVALFDLHGKEILASRFQARDWAEFEGGFLLEAGFAHVALHGGLDGLPYDRAAKRLVAVARVAGP